MLKKMLKYVCENMQAHKEKDVLKLKYYYNYYK